MTFLVCLGNYCILFNFSLRCLSSNSNCKLLKVSICVLNVLLLSTESEIFLLITVKENAKTELRLEMIMSPPYSFSFLMSEYSTLDCLHILEH